MSHASDRISPMMIFNITALSVTLLKCSHTNLNPAIYSSTVLCIALIEANFVPDKWIKLTDRIKHLVGVN